MARTGPGGGVDTSIAWVGRLWSVATPPSFAEQWRRSLRSTQKHVTTLLPNAHCAHVLPTHYDLTTTRDAVYPQHLPVRGVIQTKLRR